MDVVAVRLNRLDFLLPGAAGFANFRTADGGAALAHFRGGKTARGVATGRRSIRLKKEERAPQRFRRGLYLLLRISVFQGVFFNLKDFLVLRRKRKGKMIAG